MRAWKRWYIPRFIQYWHIFVCSVFDHKWGQWRVETEDWFEYVDDPCDYAWRGCSYCGLLQHARKSYETP